MGAVPRAKAGIGSAINDATRILGGTLGVAVIGSLYASLYAGSLSSGLGVHLPEAQPTPLTGRSAERWVRPISSPPRATTASPRPFATPHRRPSFTTSRSPAS
jgi:hypothetical protein